MAGNFSLDITNFVKKAKGNANRVVRKVAMDLSASICMKTPVDTGRALGNWTVGMDEPDTTYDKDRYDKTGEATKARMQAAIASYDGTQSIFITNSVPYIQRLEKGHSKIKAPQGMVRISLLEYDGIVEEAARQAGK